MGLGMDRGRIGYMCPTTACAGRLAPKPETEKSMVPRAGWPVDRRSRVAHALQKLMDVREAFRASG